MKNRRMTWCATALFLSSCLCAMDREVAPGLNILKRHAVDDLAPKAKRVETEKPPREVPPLKAYVAAYVAKKHKEEESWENSQRSPENQDRFDPSRYNKPGYVLPADLAGYVFSMEHCLQKGDRGFVEVVNEGNLDALKIILAKAGSPDNYVKLITADEDSALRFAAEKGHVHVVAFLVSQGANIHAKNDEALRFAAANGHAHVVAFLLDSGADIHAWGDAALSYAAKNGHGNVVALLLTQGSDVNAGEGRALYNAVYGDHSAVAHYLLDCGAKVTFFRDDILETVVARPKDIPLVRRLLERGAAISAPKIAATIACQGSAETAQLLFEKVKSAGVNVLDFIDRTYSYDVREQGIRYEGAQTLLKLASRANNEPVMRVMLEELAQEVEPKEFPSFVARLLNDKSE